jgi:PAS domain S-box-containing protein
VTDTKKTETRIVIIGGGKACAELLTVVQADAEKLGLEVLGVADPDENSPGVRLARELGMGRVVADFHELFREEYTRIDLVVELTGDSEIEKDVVCSLPPGAHFIGHYASRFFRNLFALSAERNRMRKQSELRVLEERNRLQHILDSLPYEILVMGKEFDVQLANRTFLEANHLELENVVGHYCYDLDHRTKAPCDVTVDGCPYWQSLQAGESFATVVPHVDKQGKEHFATVRTAPIRDEAGNTYGVVETIRDITPRISVEEKLRETRMRLDRFLDTAPLFIFMKDVRLHYRTINRQALEMLGLEETDVIGKSDFDLFPEEIARRNKTLENKVLKTATTLRHEGMIPLGGRERYFSTTLFPVVEDNEVIGLFGLREDTTELHERNEDLARKNALLSETQSHLQRVLENSLDLILLLDVGGCIESFNKGAEMALGFTEEEILGRPLDELCEDPERFQDFISEALAAGHASEYETILRRKDGEKVTCNISITAIDDSTGKPLELVVLCRDITRSLSLQADLVRADRLAAVGKLAAGVAHEINNPLAVIETIAGVFEDIVEDEGDALRVDSREMLSRAIERLRYQVKRCSTITHSLLGFVRKTHSGRSQVDIAGLLNETLDLIGSEINLVGAMIRREYDPQLPEVFVDPLLVEQIFVNLLKNAVDAVEEKGNKGEIAVRAQGVDGGVEVRIRDNGVGIPEESLQMIFDLFHTSKPAGKGTGLGLAIVHDIVKQLGGEIRVASEVGEWTSFTLFLPAS